ncbi:MAG TPA: sigma-E processing peptidase SpoIIGA [Bacillota bacterium]
MLIYADVFAAVNLLVDFCLLLAVANVTATVVPWWRLVLGALVGSAYATVALLVPSTQHPLVALVAAWAMLAVAFWPVPWRKAVAQGLALVLLAATTAGLALAVGQLAAPMGVGRWPRLSLLAVLVAAATGACLATRWWRGARRGSLQHLGEVKVELLVSGRRLSLTGRVDSGNDAYEPLSGQPVVLAAETGLRPLIGSSERLLADPRPWGRRFRLVPVTGLGGARLLLPALRVDRLTIAGANGTVVCDGVYVAIVPGSLDPGGRWQALVPSTLLIADRRRPHPRVNAQQGG